MMACFGFGSRAKEMEDLPFTNFILRVDATNGGWEKSVAKVLKKTKDVANFRMYDQAHVQVSGVVDPVKLLKQIAKSGYRAQIVHWKFGRCSRNLHMPEYQHHLPSQDYYNHFLGSGYGHYHGGTFDPYRRYGSAQYYPHQTRFTHAQPHQWY